MTTQPANQSMPTTEPIPQPEYQHHAYGVWLAWIGEDGGMMAPGHIPFLRFVAACNQVARKDCGMRNICDDDRATLDDVLAITRHDWAIAVRPEDSYFDWQLSWDGVTEATPGAFPITVMWP